MSDKQSTTEQIKKIFQWWDDRVISNRELVDKIAALALRDDFFNHLDLIPNDIIDDMTDLDFFLILKSNLSIRFQKEQKSLLIEVILI